MRSYRPIYCANDDSAHSGRNDFLQELREGEDRADPLEDLLRDACKVHVENDDGRKVSRVLPMVSICMMHNEAPYRAMQSRLHITEFEG